MSKKLKLGLLLFIVGFSGILTLLTVDVPIPSDISGDLANQLRQFKLLLLVNPTIILLLSIVIGTVLYDRVGFELPIFEKVAFRNGRRVAYLDIFKGGFFGGVISGLLLMSIAFFYSDYIPEELERFDPTILNRLVYGAFTEEIMLRFGVMTFIVWLFSLISIKNKSWIYWAGLIVSSPLFGLGHLPIVFSLTSAPTTELIVGFPKREVFTISKENIRKYLIYAHLKNVCGGQGDQIITALRNALRKKTSNDTYALTDTIFPLDMMLTTKLAANKS